MIYDRFKSVKNDINDLLRCLMQYSDYLQNQTRKITETHNSLNPITTMNSSGALNLKSFEKYVCKVKGSKCLKMQYKFLKKALMKAELYETVNMR